MEGWREGRCAERGRCWSVTQSELRVSAGRRGSRGQTQVAPAAAVFVGVLVHHRAPGMAVASMQDT